MSKESKICLIVDKNRINGIVAKAIVKTLDFQVVNVHTEQDAMSFISSGVADVVMIDGHMDDIDLHKFMEDVRSNIQGQVTPVIVTTEIPHEDMENEIYDIDADDFLNKPITTDKLATILHKLTLI